MTGYVRIDTVNNIADGNVINAADLDGEFNGVQAAFNSSTGHTHDGSSAEGAPITKLGPAQDVTISTTVLGVKTTNTVDLGTSSLKFKDFYLAGTASIGGAITYGGVTLNNAVTGTGNMVLSASPTLTGTLTAATITASGTITGNGNWVLGNADTDTITVGASYVTGTVLRSAKADTNTLSLAAYDVDGTAYTNLITLTASNTPTLALTSTGIGTINNMSIGATTASTGAFTTLSANSTVTLTGLSASQAVFTDASDNLVSNAITGTGNVVMSASPTLTGTLTAAAITASSTITGNGNWVLGNADTDTITQVASYVTGTQLKSAKTATNTLSLAAYDVDGAAYTNLITLTASNTPTLALTSTGVGTINNMSIGATTASTGAFTTLTSNGATTFTAGTASTTTGTGTLVITGGLGVSGRINAANFDGIVGANTADAGSFTTLSANSTVTLSGGTANGVAYLNGSKVLTTGSALVFDGSNLGLGVTPSAWGSAWKAYQYIGGSMASPNGSNNLILQNAYNDGTNYRYVGTAAASNYQQSSGSHIWNQAASGTAGNAITFTQAMTLDASGNLAIGGTSSFGARLYAGSANGTSYGSTAQLRLSGRSANNLASILFTDDNTSDGRISYAPNTTAASRYFSFSARGTESDMILDGSGNLLVGKTALNLAVGTSIDANTSTGSGVRVVSSATTASADGFQMYSTGTSTYRFAVSFNGTISAVSTVISSISDARLKENVRDLDVGLSEIMALKPRLYDWKEGKGANIKNARGFIAQEFETVFPDLIDESRDPAPEGEGPYKAVRADLIPVLVKAIQEQQALITQLTARITALESA